MDTYVAFSMSRHTPWRYPAQSCPSGTSGGQDGRSVMIAIIVIGGIRYWRWAGQRLPAGADGMNGGSFEMTCAATWTYSHGGVFISSSMDASCW